MAKKSVQELADARLAPPYRQPVKTLDDAMAAIGWKEEADKLLCCGEQVDIRSFIGSTYSAVCNVCKKFVFDVTGPEWSETGSAVCIPDGDQYDLNTQVCWVSGQMQAES